MTTVDDLADVRAGDKGDTLILAVVPRDADAHERLVGDLTTVLVGEHFGMTEAGAVRRTVMPNLPALVFVLPGVLGGGVTGSTVLDGHGKTLGYHLLDLHLPDSDG
ncbi:hypothetical protein KMZ32_07830 [Phycicoccus sp. MAQZ13P-2]|uniref:AtuA-related protein n=1 Tax=Phycicoccus mangrovi TaxID=2840470 RepID=UPI001C003053|nr:hypothetical protein [Phycicoccus mangrovi]MBT9254995.1 hypothetical protein [Phycicoccus mangrovi]MBT9256008.1 hypothetical protein [Phycicoccus mangrovi]MBT9273979.1 hypothetical protein [Phycicoccus mangrovi]